MLIGTNWLTIQELPEHLGEHLKAKGVSCSKQVVRRGERKSNEREAKKEKICRIRG